ncbi:putative cysteine synthase A [Corchorus olitorius]|uniref:Cysteine synthase A n=1 Tax=Corchorus olitorius TaxID=93759 RepID=A0A1R3KP34_9ROSI|nr:putative cysteine synthase A [Corchorus olitorius]
MVLEEGSFGMPRAIALKRNFREFIKDLRPDPNSARQGQRSSSFRQPSAVVGVLVKAATISGGLGGVGRNFRGFLLVSSFLACDEEESFLESKVYEYKKLIAVVPRMIGARFEGISCEATFYVPRHLPQ